MNTTMHRTQISLEREQYDSLMREARRKGISLAAVVRSLITEQLQGRSGKGAKTSQLAAIKGLGEGDGKPVGRHHNEFLYGRKRG
jgi:predicted DNA-binding ribbon-helix-helix protein